VLATGHRVATVESARVVVQAQLHHGSDACSSRARIAAGANVVIGAFTAVNRQEDAAVRAFTTIFGADIAILTHNCRTTQALPLYARVAIGARIPVLTGNGVVGVVATPLGVASVVGALVLIVARYGCAPTLTILALVPIGAYIAVIAQIPGERFVEAISFRTIVGGAAVAVIAIGRVS